MTARRNRWHNPVPESLRFERDPEPPAPKPRREDPVPRAGAHGENCDCCSCTAVVGVRP